MCHIVYIPIVCNGHRNPVVFQIIVGFTFFVIARDFPIFDVIHLIGFVEYGKLIYGRLDFFSFIFSLSIF